MKNNRFNYNLKKDGTGTIITKDGQGALHDIDFWLSSPEGSRMGMGNWGNPALHFIHDPPNKDTAIFMTMAMLRKARKDIPHVPINAIYIEVDDDNVYQVHFDVLNKTITKSVSTV